MNGLGGDAAENVRAQQAQLVLPQFRDRLIVIPEIDCATGKLRGKHTRKIGVCFNPEGGFNFGFGHVHGIQSRELDSIVKPPKPNNFYFPRPMDTLGQRFKAAMDARNLKPADLIARKVLSKAGVYQWTGDIVKPDKVRAETVAKICKALNIRKDWLLDGKGQMDADESVVHDSEGWSDITGYAQAVGLSDGQEAEEYAVTHNLKFRTESLARKRLIGRQLAVMYGNGDSMEPRIQTGDAILFDQSDTKPRDGHIYVIMIPGVGAESYSVKRCEIIDDMVFFKADNPKGDHGWRKPKRMDDSRHPIKIIGRVRWIGSWEG